MPSQMKVKTVRVNDKCKKYSPSTCNKEIDKQQNYWSNGQRTKTTTTTTTHTQKRTM